MQRLLIPFIIGVFSQNLKAQNQEPIKSLNAVRIERESIQLDGRLDEPFWSDMVSSGGFLMQEPREGGEPTERTEIRIAYDENNLYIGAILYDSDPSGIKSFQRKRDAPLTTDDRFMWILDTFLDGRNAYFFEINPGGLMGDGLLTIGQGTSLNKSWDGIWRPWTYVGDFGWSTEIRIPFRTLNFDPSSDAWGINFQRTIRRKNEELLWTGHRRNQGLVRPQNAGRLEGLKDISQGLGLEIVPYGKLGREKTEVENNEGSFDQKTVVEGGFDVNYSITPSLKASFTLNTDFAETEVDNRQVNLTRFPLFFPERRDFFLEGSNIYTFAPSSGIFPYFSRRIGLEEGSPIPINYGGRILGRIGRIEIAAMQVRTQQQDTINPEDFSVLRAKANFWKESSLGIVYTRRHTKNGSENFTPVQDRHTVGADLALGTSDLLGKNFQFQAFYVMHNSASPLDDSTTVMDRSTRGIRLNFPNQPWSAAISYREFGEFYDPAVGFNRRNAFRRVEPQVRFSPLIEKSDVVRELTWRIRFEHLMSLGWDKLTQNFGVTPFSIRFESGDRMSYEVTRNFELLIQDFEIVDEVVLPIGEYVNWEHELEFQTADFRRVAYELEIEFGGFWSGTRVSYENSLTLRPLPGINLTAEYIHNNIDLDEGSFNTNLIRFIGNFDFTPFISFTSNIQYDDLSERLGLNARFRYTFTPGSDVFLVYNHNWVDDMDRFRTISSTGVIKATFTHRF